MFEISRRDLVLGSTAAGLVFGLKGPVSFIGAAQAQRAADSLKYKVGDIEVTALYDGIWRKPHDPGFIRNASIDETKDALAKAGQITEFMPIPLTVVVLKMNGRTIMMDAGSGVGQWQANATHLPANMKAAGIDYKAIDTILISHFHPDHVWGLMEKGTNKPVFENAELIVNATEYNWWTDPSRLAKLPEGRKPAGKRIAENFSKWKNWKLVDDGTEVVPGIRLMAAPGHTPGHSVYHVDAGAEQFLVSADTMYVPALLAPHPEWQGAYDQDGPMAIATRHKIIDQVIADNVRICGSHFPFPGTGSFVKDGNAYAFTPTQI